MKEYYKVYAWTDCPYCVDTKKLLVENNKQFMFCCIDESEKLLSYVKEKYNWMTVPMIIKYIKKGNGDVWAEEFIGGYSDLVKKFKCKDE